MEWQKPERATPGDLDWLLQLIEEFCRIDQHEYDPHRLRSSLPALLESDEYGVVWKMPAPTEAYAVVTWGYSLESGGREALIDELYVRARGKGNGRRFLEHILDDCRQRGFVRIFLETESHNTRVRAFYGRAGFAEDDSIWMSRWLC
ncbi:MAG: GNAT family N-acetyltransferase [Halieaceae bacterium]|nr:GNAT family N-acetyltransferase [Halieaceae bacterium]